MPATVLQILPRLDAGGVERGTLEVAAELVRQNHRSLVVSAPGRLVPRLIAEGSEHIALPVGSKSLSSLRLVSRLRRLFEERNIDIIHARSRLPAWLAWLAWKKLDPENRPAFVTTVHGPYTVNHYSRIMTVGERVIAVSRYIKNYILTNYPDVDEKKIILIHRGVNKKYFSYHYQAPQQWQEKWLREFPDYKNRFIITLPGRITRWKGHNDFVEIISRASKTIPNILGLIVGSPDPGKQRFLNELKKQIGKYQTAQHFAFTDHRYDIREIMSISDIVLSLAKVPEAFGRTALEALSLGVPVIAYDHGGAAEVLAEIFPRGRIKPNNIDDVVLLIERFHQTAPVIMDKNSFSLKNMLDRTLAVYHSCL